MKDSAVSPHSKYIISGSSPHSIKRWYGSSYHNRPSVTIVMKDGAIKIQFITYTAHGKNITSRPAPDTTQINCRSAVHSRPVTPVVVEDSAIFTHCIYISTGTPPHIVQVSCVASCHRSPGVPIVVKNIAEIFKIIIIQPTANTLLPELPHTPVRRPFIVPRDIEDQVLPL